MDRHHNRVDQRVGRRVAELRMMFRYDVAEVAGWLAISDELFEASEQGHRRFRADELFVMAGRFDVPVAVFISDIVLARPCMIDRFGWKRRALDCI